jgi:hypothetical protein
MRQAAWPLGSLRTVKKGKQILCSIDANEEETNQKHYEQDILKFWKIMFYIKSI